MRVDASGIRRVFDLAAKLKDPINLSIGQPDFDVPDPAKLAAIDAIRAGQNRYTLTQGIPELRTRLRAQLTRQLDRDPGEVLITSGVSGGLLLAMLAVVDPGDEVIWLDPFFVMYPHLMTMCGGVGVPVSSSPDFRFNVAAVEAAITPRTKAILLNSPANPTGTVLSEQDIRAAVELARKHDLLIISDEIYDAFVYDQPFVSPARFYEKTLVLKGFSKTHAMTGWRLGYAAGPADLIDAMTRLQQYTYVCAPSALQHGALAALDLDMSAAIADYHRKRDIVLEMLGDKFEIVRPGGAFYAFPKVPPSTTGSAFVEKAIANNVLIIPGKVFSAADTHFRLSFATTDEKLRRGCEILRSLA
ncbi:MAG TPA: aminotransferase class I/II-fold pyridoxal phosphate-dependent enzyme [Tepidisphaeraceae bacterium]|nr:aminotransferase class I/II-fold pyridoxal phosphate-dependent enzyme [Tepidisphaeraceae bacterium]